MTNLLLIGCGGHARSVIDLVESTGKWKLIGLIGYPEQVGSLILGHRVIGSDADLVKLRDSCGHALLAVGQIGAASQRLVLAKSLEQFDFESPTIISPHAVVSNHAKVGFGTTIGHNAIVNAAAEVGIHCIINSAALIEHDVVISDHCHISTGALINGGVKIGNGSFVGSGAMLREGLEIPPNTVISAGKRVMGWPLL